MLILHVAYSKDLLTITFFWLHVKCTKLHDHVSKISKFCKETKLASYISIN